MLGPWKVNFHSKTSDSRVHARNRDRCQNLVHLQHCGIVTVVVYENKDTGQSR